MGTPFDSDGDGLTDAYELLVSHTDPHNAYSNMDGILDGWEILLGLNPQTSNLTTPSERANYGYTLGGLVERGFRDQEWDNQSGQRGQRAFSFTIIVKGKS